MNDEKIKKASDEYACDQMPDANARDAVYHTTGDSWDDLQRGFEAGAKWHRDQYIQTTIGEWQLCPKCLGTGIIHNGYSMSCPTSSCDVCYGKKVLPKPFVITTAL